VIAVMGGAGNVGSKVADRLLKAGEEVRALEHARDLTDLKERGAEVVTGDAMSSDDLRAFFDGAVAALVLLPENVADPMFVEHRRTMSRAICDALRDSGVGHVVALSSVGAALADAPGPPGGLHGFERDLAELDSNVLVVRSAAYMDYLLAAVPLIKAQKVNGTALAAHVLFPMVATQDVAREAADRLRRRDFSGHEIRLLLGPEEITMAEATKAIGERLGMTDLPYLEFPPDGVKGSLVGAGMSEQVAGLIVDMQLAVNDGRYFEGVRRTRESTTSTRLEDFFATALPVNEALSTEEGR
jgi:uncharacterized protein YbjT (DUF2867 family)